jgi:hypothetical protein
MNGIISLWNHELNIICPKVYLEKLVIIYWSIFVSLREFLIFRRIFLGMIRVKFSSIQLALSIFFPIYHSLFRLVFGFVNLETGIDYIFYTRKPLYIREYFL